MIITIFGASGKIGRLLTEQALGKGYIIKAYVHNLQEIGLSHPNLEIVEGTIHDYYKIKQAITESNAVISTMEPSKSFKKKGYPIFEAHRHIIMAMERLHIKRFITITSPVIQSGKDAKSAVTIVPKLFIRLFRHRTYLEFVAIGHMIKKSKLDWTIVRYLYPTNKPHKGKIKVSFGKQKIKFAVSRADIAKFILDQVESREYIHCMPIIGN